MPDDYPFPESVLGRGRDFRFVFPHLEMPSSDKLTFPKGLLVHGDRAWRIQYPGQRGESPSRHQSQRTKAFRKFYCEEHYKIGEVYARFAFCKDLDTLRAAADRLKNMAKYLKNKKEN